MVRNMKNPLRKRYLRELVSEPGKYLGIFLLLVSTIGFVSGFMVADHSMLQAYNESFEKYNVEDGHFVTDTRLTVTDRDSLENLGIQLYDSFYVEDAMENGSTLRLFAKRQKVNLECLMQGEFPENDDEIAIDRMYADNNHLSVGDTVSDGTRIWKISGLVALSDYSALFQNNGDMMFDAVKFGVGIVKEEVLDMFDSSRKVYAYSWTYTDKVEDEKQRSDTLMEDMSDIITLQQYLPRYQNQAINFTGEDMGSDGVMIEVLLYIVIVIMAFVFAITIKDTISRESNVIGTLRASGYTRMEMVRHYMCMPLCVTLISALIGNILGYTVLKDVCADMYYGSYSLPTYVTIWNPDAFIRTTCIPVVLMAVITFGVLYKTMCISPLRLIRKDLKKSSHRRTLILSDHIPFLSRYRIRVALQNIPDFLALFTGILFASLLLFFGLMLPKVLDGYQATIEKNMVAEYQYILTMPSSLQREDRKLESYLAMLQYAKDIETDTEGAEKFSAYALKTEYDPSVKQDDVNVYGIQENSAYIHENFEKGKIYASYLLADKYGLQKGSTLVLKEPYDSKTYTFTIDGIYDDKTALCLYMNIDSLNEMFDLGKDFFAGYYSHEEIKDIPEEYIGTCVNEESLTKVTRQLDVSMGSMMYLIDGFSVLIFIVLMYLMSKVIIEKNTQPISMTKILGYASKEIAGIYIAAISIVVMLCLLVSLPLCYEMIRVLWMSMIKESMSGWLLFEVPSTIYMKLFVIGMASYAVCAILEYVKITHIPMEEALKNVE